MYRLYQEFGLIISKSASNRTDGTLPNAIESAAFLNFATTSLPVGAA